MRDDFSCDIVSLHELFLRTGLFSSRVHLVCSVCRALTCLLLNFFPERPTLPEHLAAFTHTTKSRGFWRKTDFWAELPNPKQCPFQLTRFRAVRHRSVRGKRDTIVALWSSQETTITKASHSTESPSGPFDLAAESPSGISLRSCQDEMQPPFHHQAYRESLYAGTLHSNNYMRTTSEPTPDTRKNQSLAVCLT